MKKLGIIGMLVVMMLVTGCDGDVKNLQPVVGNAFSYDFGDDLADSDTFDRNVLPGEEEYYYTFTGESEHFTFSSGIADYRDDNAILRIAGLKAKSKENFTSTISVNFSDKNIFIGTFTNESIKDNNIIMGEYGKKIRRDEDGHFYGEIDAFMQTKPDDFASAIKIVANYCDEKNDCSVEEFLLDITKHE